MGRGCTASASSAGLLGNSCCPKEKRSVWMGSAMVCATVIMGGEMKARVVG